MAVNLQIGERISVKIDDVAFGGDGVARVSDFVLFVPFTVDGDEVEAEVTDIKKYYGKGRIVRLLKPSPSRVPSPCPYYTLCGGCRMQHISYPHQLELKKRQIEEALKRIAGIFTPPVAPVTPSGQPFGWRGKAEFHHSGRGGKTAHIGFMASKSNSIIDIESCLIVNESINQKYALLRKKMIEGAILALRRRLVVWADQPGEPRTEVFTGKGNPPDIVRIVLGKRLTVPGAGFFQANIFLAESLTELVVEMATLSGGETVIDLYGGVGLFSLFLGSGANHLFCIERDEEAVRCARINLNRQGLTEAKCYQGDAADVLKRAFVVPQIKADVLVLDPPREGCSLKVIAAISSLQPKRIIYVSCNPSTLARDVKLLAGSGYCLQIIQPLDMFPQTSHIEVIALLTTGS